MQLAKAKIAETEAFFAEQQNTGKTKMGNQQRKWKEKNNKKRFKNKKEKETTQTEKEKEEIASSPP